MPTNTIITPAPAGSSPAGEAAASRGQSARAAATTTRSRRKGAAFALVPERATHQYYIWDYVNDEWHGTYATRLDAELTLVRWRSGS